MKTFLTTLALFVFFSGILLNKVYSSKKSESLNDSLSEKEDVRGDFDMNNESEVVVPTNTPTTTPKVQSVQKSEEPSEISLYTYKYPNSFVTSSNKSELILSSTDDENIITEWYKNKIKESGMNISTFVVTKTNDRVLNKLVGANDKSELRVEIVKGPDSSKVTINVSFKIK